MSLGLAVGLIVAALIVGYFVGGNNPPKSVRTRIKNSL